MESEIQGAAAAIIRPNLRNRYRAQFEFATGVERPETLPTALQFALNNTCNFKCVYCTDHRAGNDIKRTQLDGKVFADLVEAIPRAELLAFHGINEFFIDKSFFDLVQRCADAGARLALNTNGSVATPRHLEVLKNYPGRILINFSLDAATAETFKKIRGWDFERVIRNVRSYAQMFATRRDRTWMSVSFVITRGNVHEMVPFVELAADLGVNEVIFYRLNDYDRLAWRIEAPDGSIFDYREECADRYKDLHDRHARAATAAAERHHLRIDVPALFEETVASEGGA